RQRCAAAVGRQSHRYDRVRPRPSGCGRLSACQRRSRGREGRRGRVSVLRRLRFRYRIGLLVLLATVALITVTIVTLVLGQRSERELIGIETLYVPLIELDRDLNTAFLELTRALEDAAAAADEGRLADAERLDREFLLRLAGSRDTVARHGGDPVALERDYRAYFASARTV